MFINKGTDEDDEVQTTQWNCITQSSETMQLCHLQRCGQTETVIPSEVSQKEKNKYPIISPIFVESRKMIQMNLTCKAQIKIQT